MHRYRSPKGDQMDYTLFYYTSCAIGGAIVGFLYGRTSPTKLISSAIKEYITRKQCEQSEETIKILNNENSKLTTDFNAVEKENIELKIKSSALEEACRIRRKALKDYKYKYESAIKELQSTKEELSRLQQTAKNQQNFQEHIKEMQELSLTRLIDDQKRKIMENIQSLIEPIKKQLENDSISRAGSINNLEALFHNTDIIQKTLLSQVNIFTKNFKIVGNWGEQHLMSLFDAHGLQQNVDYWLLEQNEQVRGCKVRCAQNIEISIYTTIPLEQYYDYVNAEDKTISTRALSAFIKAIKEQIDTIICIKNEGAFQDFTILYVPIEAALMAMLNGDPQLYEYSAKKKVLLVSTSMIFVIMHALKQLKQFDEYYKNAENISKEAGVLVHKFTLLAESILRANNNIVQAHNACQESIECIINDKNGIMQHLNILAEDSKPTLSAIDDQLKETAEHQLV